MYLCLYSPVLIYDFHMFSTVAVLMDIKHWLLSPVT